MRKLVFHMNLSLDGCVDHQVTIADDELHRYFSRVLDGLDSAMFGRVSYQLMESYWPVARDDPRATPGVIEFADKFNAMPKVVFSKTLAEARWNNTRLVRADVLGEIERLKRAPGKDLSIAGIGTCRDLLRRGWIDELTLVVHPVVWGPGPRLFDDVSQIRLKLLEQQTFGSGAVALRYAVER